MKTTIHTRPNAHRDFHVSVTAGLAEVPRIPANNHTTV